MNVVNYLLDESGFMQLRGREVKLRLLDQAKLAESGLLWQLVNIVLPVAIVFVCGFLVLFLRRKKFTKPLNS
jgi:ABC-2 type transport system permease protein